MNDIDNTSTAQAIFSNNNNNNTIAASSAAPSQAPAPLVFSDSSNNDHHQQQQVQAATVPYYNPYNYRDKDGLKMKLFTTRFIVGLIFSLLTIPFMLWTLGLLVASIVLPLQRVGSFTSVEAEDIASNSLTLAAQTLNFILFITENVGYKIFRTPGTFLQLLSMCCQCQVSL